MLIPYNYDNGMKVLKLLKENKISTFNLTKQDGVIIMEYILISDLSPSAQERSLNILQESIKERLYLIKLLNDFIVSKAVGRDIKLEIRFNSADVSKLEFYHHLIGNMVYSDSNNTDYERAMLCIDTLESILTNAGSLNSQLVNIYRKVSNGRSRKYYPVTFDDILHYIRKVVE